jgi:hypothetical protein
LALLLPNTAGFLAVFRKKYLGAWLLLMTTKFFDVVPRTLLEIYRRFESTCCWNVCKVLLYYTILYYTILYYTILYFLWEIEKDRSGGKTRKKT